MAYNLIDERWIPVERRSGKVEMIAPAEIAEREDPPLRVASPRPDFDGALLEFLIGLLQTAAAPANERAWEHEFHAPPMVHALKKRLDVVREAFFLDGDRPRFMQQSTLTDDNSKLKPIGYLLVDRVGEENIADGPSLFAKPGLAAAMSYPAAAAALYLMQSRAPSGGGGGGGHFTSLRGGSALATVILGESLWQTAWLNVIALDAFGPCVEAADPKAFVWMNASWRGNPKQSPATPASSVHPAHAFWALPRRVLLAEQLEATCAVYNESGRSWGSLRTATVGKRYEGLLHPLAAYTRTAAQDSWLPFLTPEEGFTYRDWPTIVHGSPRSMPARVVSTFLASARRRGVVTAPRLAVFGYAMDSMKPLRWCRAETPLVAIDLQLTNAFFAETEALVAASDHVRSALLFALRSAWSDRPKDLDAFDVLRRIDPAFWSRTEPDFFASVHGLKAGLEADDSNARDLARDAWLGALHQAALDLFDTFVEVSADLAAPDLRRAVLARRSLDHFTQRSSSKLRKLLGLPVEESEKPEKVKASRTRNPRKESNP